MSEAFWTAFWVALPVTMTSAASAYVVIRQTNAKAKETNALVAQNTEITTVVADRVNGNVTRLNDQLDTATAKIDELHQKIVVAAVQAEADKKT